ncbi:hypothetical protein DM860_016716 [Cuscuta australis]|uniref:Uncharacterized protein n=1 Tax=Cuscuta australis TaxID=267555 RepID=A0A328DQL1_9ASTE|nr:hypothetical protein DM860_016716 [Cuscuta australis]
MIHRKWSLLTGPTAVVGAVVGVIVVSHFIFVQNVTFFSSIHNLFSTPFCNHNISISI